MQEIRHNYTIKTSENFRGELNEILDYMFYNLYPSTPIRFIDQIINVLINVSSFPKMYMKYEKIKKYRRIIVGYYIIFYNINYNKKTIEVKHIYHSRRDSFNLNS